jgi:serine phosphatase RsbU (regulator of sigma subunit)/CheY-like chemotaxis protein
MIRISYFIRTFVIAFAFFFVLETLFGQGGKEKTIADYENLINKYQQEGNIPELANYQAKLGYLYWETGNNSKAIEYFNKAIENNETLRNENAIRTLSSNIGLIYYDREEYEKALTYLRKSLQLNIKLRKRADVAADYINISNALHDLKKFDEAIDNINKALPIFQETNDIKGIRSCYTSLADNYGKLGKNEKAKEYFDLAATINKKLQQEEIQQYESRTRDAEATSKMIKEELLVTKDTLKETKGTLKEVIQISNEQQMAIDLLNKTKEIDSLKLKAKDNLLSQQKRKRKNTIITFVVILVIVSTFSFFIFRQLNEKKKANKLLEQQNRQIIDQKKEIEAQHEIVSTQKQKITDSILYAQRIQKAILPPDEEFLKIFPEHFILYKPRDIVSGDFFWLMQKEGIIIVAAADCTGHGVPGAFMSMLGVAYLNEIVTNVGINKHIRALHASDILNHLREKFIQSLHQKGEIEEAKDGMEISLCIFDMDNHSLQFAGAHNSAYIIRNNELIKLEADKMPIGISVNYSPFTNREYEIKHGDMVYMFSDGYYDQFGGPNGLKFLSGNFRKLLLEIHQQPVAEQKKRLEETIEKWKGDREQLDDMLVIGIRMVLEKDEKASSSVAQKKRILIAEDTELNYFLLVQALRNSNVQIFRASNGQEAVDFCRANELDMVLMDINMPLMDGIEATKLIREFNAKIPIIAQTALDIPGQKDQILNAGCNDYISKPIDLKLFLSIIKKYIEI